MKNYISDLDGFELGVNCLLHLYRLEYREENLQLLHRLCDSYLEWFSVRAVEEALRVLLHSAVWSTVQKEIPESQKEEYGRLLKRLTRQGITLHLLTADRELDKEQSWLEWGSEIGFYRGFCFSEYLFEDAGQFGRWVRENHLEQPAACRFYERKDILPISKNFQKDFEEICYAMLRYSCEWRQERFFAVCVFLEKNRSLLSGEAVKRIGAYIKTVWKK